MDADGLWTTREQSSSKLYQCCVQQEYASDDFAVMTVDAERGYVDRNNEVPWQVRAGGEGRGYTVDGHFQPIKGAHHSARMTKGSLIPYRAST